MGGTVDACDQITKDKSGLGDALTKFGMPNKCPVEKVSSADLHLDSLLYFVDRNILSRWANV